MYILLFSYPEKLKYDGFIFISLSGKGGLPVILKAIMENDVEDNFLQYLLGVGDVSDFIQRKENLPQLPTTSGLFQTCPDTKSTVLEHFYMLYIYIFGCYHFRIRKKTPRLKPK